MSTASRTGTPMAIRLRIAWSNVSRLPASVPEGRRGASDTVRACPARDDGPAGCPALNQHGEVAETGGPIRVFLEIHAPVELDRLLTGTEITFEGVGGHLPLSPYVYQWARAPKPSWRLQRLPRPRPPQGRLVELPEAVEERELPRDVLGKHGAQVPLDEIVFLPELPVRTEQVTAVVGGPASGPADQA